MKRALDTAEAIALREPKALRSIRVQVIDEFSPPIRILDHGTEPLTAELLQCLRDAENAFGKHTEAPMEAGSPNAQHMGGEKPVDCSNAAIAAAPLTTSSTSPGQTVRAIESPGFLQERTPLQSVAFEYDDIASQPQQADHSNDGCAQAERLETTTKTCIYTEDEEEEKGRQRAISSESTLSHGSGQQNDEDGPEENVAVEKKCTDADNMLMPPPTATATLGVVASETQFTQSDGELAGLMKNDAFAISSLSRCDSFKDKRTLSFEHGSMDATTIIPDTPMEDFYDEELLNDTQDVAISDSQLPSQMYFTARTGHTPPHGSAHAHDIYEQDDDHLSTQADVTMQKHLRTSSTCSSSSSFTVPVGINNTTDGLPSDSHDECKNDINLVDCGDDDAHVDTKSISEGPLASRTTSHSEALEAIMGVGNDATNRCDSHRCEGATAEGKAADAAQNVEESGSQCVATNAKMLTNAREIDIATHESLHEYATGTAADNRAEDRIENERGSCGASHDHLDSKGGAVQAHTREGSDHAGSRADIDADSRMDSRADNQGAHPTTHNECASRISSMPERPEDLSTSISTVPLVDSVADSASRSTVPVSEPMAETGENPGKTNNECASMLHPGEPLVNAADPLLFPTWPPFIWTRTHIPRALPAPETLCKAVSTYT
jgi:hypothetical protein